MEEVKTIKIKCEAADTLEFEDLTPFQEDIKFMLDEDLANLKKWIVEDGFITAAFVWKNNGKNYILDAHQRQKALRSLQEDGYIIPPIPVNYINCKDKQEAKRFLARIISQAGRFDKEKVIDFFDIGQLEGVRFMGDELDMSGWGDEDDGIADDENGESRQAGALADRFLVPPFSVFDARQGYWVDRKRMWIGMRIDNVEVRDKAKNMNEAFRNKAGNLISFPGGGVSILDPVLAEVCLYWFCTPKGAVFDCFAGDAVFGFVSGFKDYSFVGIELRQEQVDFNNQKLRDNDLSGTYICDDGCNVMKHLKPESQDMLFSCPPYFNLEVYSELEEDASTQDNYDDFMVIIKKAFTESIKALKNNRFAVVVCGDIRHKKHKGYYCYPADMKKMFIDAGLLLWNEIILLDPLGTAAMRADRYMDSRKVVKVHQNVLVFYKGDPKQIKTVFPKIETKEAEAEDHGSEDI